MIFSFNTQANCIKHAWLLLVAVNQYVIIKCLPKRAINNSLKIRISSYTGIHSNILQIKHEGFIWSAIFQL
jgi:hypothetical protein